MKINNFINNKRGDGTWLTADTGRFVLTVLAVIFLLLIVVKFFAFFTTQDETKKMQREMKKLFSAVSEAYADSSEKTVRIYPVVGWYLRSFPDNDFPDGECEGAVGCICFCKDIGCKEKRECREFMFDVVVAEFFSSSSSSGFDQFGSGLVTISEGTLLLKSVEELRVVKIKEEKVIEGIVKIKEEVVIQRKSMRN